jgi:hypothetical protein
MKSFVTLLGSETRLTAPHVNIACNAVLGTCVGVNQILGGTSASPLLQQLFNEYGAENPPHGVPQAA